MSARRNGRGGRRPGSGAKPKPAEERQRNRIMVSFTDTEHDALVDAAEGKALGTYLRELAIRSLRRLK